MLLLEILVAALASVGTAWVAWRMGRRMGKAAAMRRFLHAEKALGRRVVEVSVAPVKPNLRRRLRRRVTGPGDRTPHRHGPVPGADRQRGLEGALILATQRAILNRQSVELQLAEIALKDLIREAQGPQITIATMVARSSAQGITGLAVLLAGRQRSSLRDEWRSHLAGETGRGLPSGQRIRAALGFVVAAVRCRVQDAADAGWRLAEAVLKSRPWSNIIVFVPTGVAAIVILCHDGAAGTLAAYGSIAALGGSLYMLIRAGRSYRDVKPPEPKARRAKE